MDDDELTLDEDEMTAELAALFPHGWGGPDVLAELAPEGWEQSPLARTFHPTAEQCYQEALNMHRNMANSPLRREDAPPAGPEPTRDEFPDVPPEYEPPRECQELVGKCVWDVFSDNHTVTAADGRRFETGSHRYAGEFLANVINAQGGPKPLPKPGLDAMLDELFAQNRGPEPVSPLVQQHLDEMRQSMVGDGGYTYLDFYMGTIYVAGRADLAPVYAMLFRRMRQRGLDWKYTFPRLYLWDPRPLKDALDAQKKGADDFEGYDPEAAFEKEQADAKRAEEVASMRAAMDEDYRAAVEASRDREPPATVRAYHQVYGDWPEGWPPEA